MKLIVGLGNPGTKYKNNRHNVGYMIIDALVSNVVNGQWSMVKKLHSLIISQQSSVILAKPRTMMNNSGLAARMLVNQYNVKSPNIWVVHDDLDIDLGAYKIQTGRGPRLHGGSQFDRKRASDQRFLESESRGRQP